MELFLTLKLYLHQTEWFEIEEIICIKMDLTLNNLQRLIYHKPQTTNHRNHLTVCKKNGPRLVKKIIKKMFTNYKFYKQDFALNDQQ